MPCVFFFSLGYSIYSIACLVLAMSFQNKVQLQLYRIILACCDVCNGTGKTGQDMGIRYIRSRQRHIGVRGRPDLKTWTDGPHLEARLAQKDGKNLPNDLEDICSLLLNHLCSELTSTV